MKPGAAYVPAFRESAVSVESVRKVLNINLQHPEDRPGTRDPRNLEN